MKSEKEKNYCNICDGNFDNIKSHFKTAHEHLKKHKCGICNRGFMRLKSLQSHVAIVHQKLKNFFCKLCEKSFAEKAQLTRHLKTHQEDGENSDNLSSDFEVKEDGDDSSSNESSGEETDENEVTIPSLTCGTEQVFVVSMKPDDLKSKIKNEMQEQEHNDLLADSIDPSSGVLIEEDFLKHEPIEIKEEVLDEECQLNQLGGFPIIKCEPDIINFQDSNYFNDNFEMDMTEETNKPYIANSSIKCELDIPVSSLESINLQQDLNNVCSNCGEVFENEKMLTVHELEKHNKKESLRSLDVDKEEPKKVYKCLLCDRFYKTQQHLKFHHQAMHNNKSFDCDTCDRKFSYKTALDRHLRAGHGSDNEDSDDNIDNEEQSDKEHKCLDCGLSFKSTILMQKHFEELHRNANGLTCGICEREFTKQEHLNQHYFAVHTDNTYDCKECGRGFSFKSALERHIKVVHENRKDHVCSACGKEFGNKYDLNQHFEFTHQTGTPANVISCSICGREFTKQEHLKMHHSAVHTDNTFDCKDCGRGFSYKSALDRHIKVVHENRKDFICSACGKEFGSRYDLNQHFDGTHAVENDEEKRESRTCKVCGKIFMKERNLKMHYTAVHTDATFDCPVCQKKFSFKSALERHVKVVHENQKNHVNYLL